METTAQKGSRNYRYAGILHPARGKSEGIGVGSNSHTTSQTKMLKPTHNKTCTAKASPVMPRSGKANVVCFHCGEHGHKSNQVHVMSYSSPSLACDTDSTDTHNSSKNNISPPHAFTITLELLVKTF